MTKMWNRWAIVLLAGLVLWPLIAAVPVALMSHRHQALGGMFAAAACGVTAIAAGLLFAAGEPVSVRLPALIGAIELSADPAGRTFASVAAFVWFCASLHAVGYLRGDPAAGRLRATALVLLSANLGVFVAADWLGLLVFFEVLGIVGLLFVVHAGDDAARRAGMKYFWLTLAGGVALLGGIALLYQAAGSIAFAPFPDSAVARWAAALMLIGFGVKAGMIGLHVWLPDAHSVAPAPASALLSGVMIKAGAFGVFRCLGELAVPEMAWSFGAAVVGLGMAGMLVGAVAALAQRQAKRLLAWSSISQMGFILAALGAGADHLLSAGVPGGVEVGRLAGPRLAAEMAAYLVGVTATRWKRLDRAFLGQRSRSWRPFEPGPTPAVGLLGTGAMSAATARAFRALDVPVLAWNRSGRSVKGMAVDSGPDGLRRVAGQSDVLINLLPLTDETRDLLDASLFRAMRPGSMLVNVGRGEHLVEPDLLEALDEGRPGCAVLDVFREEPLPEGHPFWTHPRILVTPHCAAVTRTDEAAELAAESYRRVSAGEPPLGRVDRRRGY